VRGAAGIAEFSCIGLLRRGRCGSCLSCCEPFAGTYVPLEFNSTQDIWVRSVMVELRRETYLEVENGMANVAGMLACLIDTVDAHR